MKRLIATLMALTILLSACGETEPDTPTTQTSSEREQNEKSDQKKKNDSETVSSQKSNQAEQSEKSNDIGVNFDGTNLNFNYYGTNYSLVVNEYKVIQPGQPGNEYGDKPIIAFYYTVNFVDSVNDVTPLEAWHWVLSASQKKEDGSAIDVLNQTYNPNEDYFENENDIMLPNNTFNNAIAYVLDNQTNPVYITAEVGGMMCGIGEYSVQQ